MTTVSTIISDALRESGILAIEETPSAAMSAEALRRLENVVQMALGTEVGEDLIPMSYDDYSDQINARYAPANVRLYFALEDDTTVALDPNPRDGARFAVVDVADNFATHNLVLSGNGRTIEDVSSLLLNTNSVNKEWIYRADLGNWALVSPLTEAGTFPFPADCEDFFVISLAMRLNPRYGQELSASSIAALRKAQSKIRAKYRQVHEQYSDLALLKLSGRLPFDSDFDGGIPWSY